MTANCGVVLFHTDAAVFRAERLLQAAGIDVALVPTPREFSSDCGLAIRVPWDASEQVLRRLQAAGIEFVALHTTG
jgi:transposase